MADLHAKGVRQGPGSDRTTLRALALTGLDDSIPLQVADFGCGTGAATLVLAEALPSSTITAVDREPRFLEELRERARERGVGHRINTLEASLEDVPLPEASLDLIWSEGAIYNIGFAEGVSLWRRLLRPGGILVASEITWTTRSRPDELEDYWRREYPEIDTASAKLKLLEDAGYQLLAYFLIPETCWVEEFYRPLEARFPEFIRSARDKAAAQAIVAAEEREIELYKSFREYFGYGMYLARYGENPA